MMPAVRPQRSRYAAAVIAATLLAAGALPAGFFIWAAILAVALVGESVAGWVLVGRVARPVEYEDEEDEGQ